MGDTGPTRVLLVDDEEAILFAFKRMLQAPGVEICTADSLDEAIKWLESGTYAAVIADLRLSGSEELEGYQVVSVARRLHPDAMIIVMTAYGANDTRRHVMNLGATHYLEKPISPLTIKEMLRAIGVYGLVGG